MSTTLHIESLEERTLFSVQFVSSHYPVADNANGNLFAPVIGDFDSDGKVDLVIPDATTTQSAAGQITFAKGDGAGKFTLGSPVAAGVFGYQMKAGDFNGDGKLDLVASNPGDQSSTPQSDIILLLGNGDGTFQAPRTLTVGSNPLTIAVGDFNGDGKSDVAVGNRAGSTVSILLGDATSGLVAGQTLTTGTDPASLVAGDFNNDGKTDLVVGNAGGGAAPALQTFLGNGDGTFSTTAITSSGPPGVTGIGDFNNDGNLDVAVSVSGAGTPTLLLGNGSGGFSGSGTYPSTGFSALVADFDGDGKTDIAADASIGNGSNTDAQVLTGKNDGTFSAPVIVPADNPGPGNAGDLNGDGKPDLVFAGQTSDGRRVIDVLLNQSVPGSGPNLTGQFISTFPAAVVGGGKGKAVVRITNNGNEVAAGKVAVSLFADDNGADTLIGTVTKKIKLKTNKSKNYKFQFHYPSTVPDGNYSIVAQVDSSNVISEASESDNTVTSATPVTIAAPFVDLAGNFASALPTALSAGQKTKIAVQVVNNGNVPAKGALTINLVAATGNPITSNDPVIATMTHQINLKPSKQAVRKVKVKVPDGIAGNRLLVAIINPANAITETDPSNNTIFSGGTITFS